MAKRFIALALAAALALGCVPALADWEPDEGGAVYYDGNYYYYYDPDETAGAPVLTSLTHNCGSTGVMLPGVFDGQVTAYILTVASWVSRVSFTPVASDPQAVIRVNGTVIRSGSSTSYFRMDDKPQQVTIEVSNGMGTTVYTVFLQRRPSEKRTRVSAGSVNRIYESGGKWYIDADLGTVTYTDGNLSTYLNKAAESYKYPCSASCVFYFGDIEAPVRAFGIADFTAQYDPLALYRFIYIEDEIVAVLPYAPDY